MSLNDIKKDIPVMMKLIKDNSRHKNDTVNQTYNIAHNMYNVFHGIN